LSIIDVDERSNQPMVSNSGNTVIVFNGEIYNFQELKKELSGYKFKTKSDTEVILAGYEKWGCDIINKLSGIFAFALWDEIKKELILARDHVGVKPLYYYHKDNTFIFSSEIKGILEHNVPRILNKEAFQHYMRVLYTPEPMTMFEGIYKFPAASYGIYKDGVLSIHKYWDIDYKKTKESKEEIKKTIKEKVSHIVKKQLVSDRPIGLYLSGGIDSSVVLERTAKFRSNIKTFSVGFELTEGEEVEKFNADLHLAKRTAQFYGTQHNEVMLTIDDVIRDFEKTVWHLDEPISNPTMISMMRLAHFAKEQVDVVLGGDGGDELFGGYPRYQYSSMMDMYQDYTPSFIRSGLERYPQFKKMNIPQGVERIQLFHFQKDPILSKVMRDVPDNSTYRYFMERFFLQIDNRDFAQKFMDTDRQTWLADYSLMLSDKITMSAELEERVPLLDKELVEYAATIPTKYKVDIFGMKKIFKEAFKNDLPKFIFEQPKRGWASPGAKWLRNEKMVPMVKQIISPDYYKETESLFDWDEVRSIVDAHNTKEMYNLTIIWNLLTFQVWAKRYGVKVR